MKKQVVQYLAKNMTKEMAITGGKQVCKYGARLAALGGLGIVAGVGMNKSKKMIVETGKNITKTTENELKDLGDIVSGKKKIEPIKKTKEAIVGAAKLTGAALGVGALGIATYKLTDMTRKGGIDLVEEITADMRSLEYDIEQQMMEEIEAEEINY